MGLLGTSLIKFSLAPSYGIAQRLLTFLTTAFLGTTSFTTLAIALQLAQVGGFRGCQGGLRLFNRLIHHFLPFLLSVRGLLQPTCLLFAGLEERVVHGARHHVRRSRLPVLDAIPKGTAMAGAATRLALVIELAGLVGRELERSLERCLHGLLWVRRPRVLP